MVSPIRLLFLRVTFEKDQVLGQNTAASVSVPSTPAKSGMGAKTHVQSMFAKVITSLSLPLVVPEPVVAVTVYLVL